MPINSPFEFFVQLHLTEQCNLRCKHCYQQGSLPDEMSLSEITSVIGEISDMLTDWKETQLTFCATYDNVTGQLRLQRPILHCIRPRPASRVKGAFPFVRATQKSPARLGKLDSKPRAPAPLLAGFPGKTGTGAQKREFTRQGLGEIWR
jgi:hypothetical protein